MSADPSEVEALARAFARHLEHLRDFRGVHYVGAAQVTAGVGHGLEDGDRVGPGVDASERSEPSEAPAKGGHLSGTAQSKLEGTVDATDNSPAVQSPHSGPGRPHSPRAPNHNASAPRSPLRDAQREVMRARGQQWPAAKKLAYLRDRNVGDCRRCALAESRRNIVFGVGSPEADLMFVGEAPGANEDRLGEPFVGAAGGRLDRWLEALGLSRAQVYIANVLKCRPPRNRDPKPVEIERCSPFLHAQIRAVEPKVIVALGRFAGCLLLGRDQKMYQMRGQVHRYREPRSGDELPLVVTYHPSYVIRREQEPRDSRGARGRSDSSGPIKSEDQKVLDDLARALSLTRLEA